jgi:hypothetical protein
VRLDASQGVGSELGLNAKLNHKEIVQVKGTPSWKIGGSLREVGITQWREINNSKTKNN